MASEHCGFSAILILLGFISIILQAVGFFSPAWLIFHMHVDTKQLEAVSGKNVGLEVPDTMYVSVDMGLWTTRACFDVGYGQQCGSASTEEIKNAMTAQASTKTNPAVEKMIGDWLCVQMLAVFAAIGAVVGIIGQCVLARSSDTRVGCQVSIAAVGWLLSAVLILAAVGKQATEYRNYAVTEETLKELDIGINLHFYLPWAIIVSGIGGGLAVLITTANIIYLVRRDHRGTPGGTPAIWMQVQNGKC